MYLSVYLITIEPGDLGTRFHVGRWPQSLTCVPLFSRQEDEVVLQCIANIHKEQRKFCLAAEGLGNRLCFLEPTSEAKVRSIACPAPSPLGLPAVICRGRSCRERMRRVMRKK